MESLIADLARAAQAEQAVASRMLENGIELLVYPLDEGFVVGLGLERDSSSAVKAEEILKRRSENLAVLGEWLPAMYADGSCHIFRRMPDANPEREETLLSEDDLLRALELLA